METKFTTEQVLAAVQSEATAFGRCCDCYQDGLGTFCCHDCGQKTMAMLGGVQRALGVGTKDGKPIPKMEQADAIKAALLRRAAPDMFEAIVELLATHPAAYRDPGPIDNRTDNAIKIARAALAKARGQ